MDLLINKWKICLSSASSTSILAFNRPSIHLSIHLFIHHSINPFIRPSVHPSIHPSMHISIDPFIHHSINPFIRPNVHPSMHSSIHSSIHPLFLGVGPTPHTVAVKPHKPHKARIGKIIVGNEFVRTKMSPASRNQSIKRD